MDSTTTTHTIKVPKAFWDDHLQRECVDDTYEVRELKWHFVLTLSERDLLDLYQDAWFYASESDLDFELMGLKSSARATRNAIAKQFGLEALAEMWLRNGHSVNSGLYMGLPINNNNNN